MTRGLRIVLVISLALNLFFLVAGAGIAYRHIHGGSWTSRGFEGAHLNRRAWRSALSDETRERLRENLKDERAELGQNMRAAREGRLAMAQALESEPFAPEQFAAALAASRDADANVLDATEAMMKSMVSELTPAERKALAKSIRERPRRGGRRDMRREEGGEPPPGPGP